MKTFLKIIMASLCLTSGFAAGTVQQNAIDVSLIRLIAAPQEYAKKLVRVIGYLNIEFEGNAIYLHEEDFRHSIYKNGLWVWAERDMMPELAKLSGQYVLIEGVFDPSMTGHLSMWSGSVLSINRVEPVSGERAKK